MHIQLQLNSTISTILFLDHLSERLHHHSYPGPPAAFIRNQATSGGGLYNYDYINLSIMITSHTMNLRLHTCPGLLATSVRNQATSGGGLYALHKYINYDY